MLEGIPLLQAEVSAEASLCFVQVALDHSPHFEPDNLHREGPTRHTALEVSGGL